MKNLLKKKIMNLLMIKLYLKFNKKTVDILNN